MNNRLYLVTGAAGFLGGHVCRQLIARGDKVRAFALPGDKAIKFIPEGVEVVEGNLCKIERIGIRDYLLYGQFNLGKDSCGSLEVGT